MFCWSTVGKSLNKFTTRFQVKSSGIYRNKEALYTHNSGQSAEAVNTLTASLQGIKNHPHKCPEYDTDLSYGEAPVRLELLGNAEYPFDCHCSQIYSGLEW